FMGALGSTAGRCGIYPYRPMVCRTYPTALVGEEIERREDVYCPVEAWRDGILQGRSWREQQFRSYVELNIYWLAADRWNEHVMRCAQVDSITSQDYLNYLMNFYARLEP